MLKQLTVNQKRVLLGVAQGRTYNKVANDLKIKPRTVREHCRIVIDKLNAQNMEEAIHVAFCAGVLDT